MPPVRDNLSANTSPHLFVSFGETLWDILPNGEELLGGATLNFACRVAMLGNASILASALGDDARGRAARRQLGLLGLDDRAVSTNSYPTGVAIATLGDDKSARYHIKIGVAYDRIDVNEETISLAKNADCLYFGTLIQRMPYSAASLERLIANFSGRYTIADINLRRDCYSRKTALRSLELANIVKMNDEEAAEVARMLGEKTRSLPVFLAAIRRKYNLTAAVVTMGERGMCAISEDDSLITVDGYSLDVVDTIGAGDAVSAALATGLTRGQSLEQACVDANILGAAVTTLSGASAPMTMSEARRICAAADRVELRESDLYFQSRAV